MTPDKEPALVIDPSVLGVLDELIRREPIFHRPESGTTRADFENMTVPDFWEVGASGRRYSREYVLQVLGERYASPHTDTWKTSDFHCRKLAADVYLLWKIIYHQGTIIQDA